MGEYRIVKKWNENGRDEKYHEYFVIQKKLLFWWRNASIKCITHSTDWNNCVVKTYSTRVKFHNSSKEKAEKFLDKYILNPEVFLYKGKAIRKFYNIHSRKDVYINTSDEWLGDISNYEYTLSDMQKCIDDKIIVNNSDVVG